MLNMLLDYTIIPIVLCIQDQAVISKLMFPSLPTYIESNKEWNQYKVNARIVNTTDTN